MRNCFPQENITESFIYGSSKLVIIMPGVSNIFAPARHFAKIYDGILQELVWDLAFVFTDVSATRAVNIEDPRSESTMYDAPADSRNFVMSRKSDGTWRIDT